MGMIRGIITSITEGAIKRFAASGRQNESFEDREYFQHYGFTSSPPAGAEVIVINEGNHIVAIASCDRRYRLHVAGGEVALYSDEGDRIHLKRDKTIEIKTGNKLTVEATSEVDITAPAIKLIGDIEITGDVGVTGNIHASGTIQGA